MHPYPYEGENCSTRITLVSNQKSMLREIIVVHLNPILEASAHSAIFDARDMEYGGQSLC